MKLGMCTFGGDGGKSGISRYIINLIAEFDQIAASDDTIDVMVYGSERDVFIPAQSQKLNPLEYSDSIKSPVKNIYWHQRKLPKICKTNHYDVMFLPAANRRTCLSLPCPMVGTVHDFSSLHVAGKYDPARMFYIRKVLPFLIRKLDHVVTISESSRRDIVEYSGVDPKKVTIIPLAADHSVYFPADREEAAKAIRTKYNIPGPYILYTSRLEHPGKNHVRLIQAFSQLKEKHDIPHILVLAGSDWSGSEAIHEEAKRSKFSDHIIFPGFVPTSDLPNFYRGADLFVFPSLYEGFGLPILEAMACGTATTCSNVASMPEVAGDAAPTFDPYNVDEIEDTMSRLLTNDSKREECMAKGIARAAEFNWKKTAEKTLEVLRSVQ